MEVKVAKENEVIQLSGVGTVKSVGFLRLGSSGCAFTMTEFVGHEHYSLGKVWGRMITEQIFGQVFISSFFLVGLGIRIIDDSGSLGTRVRE